MDYKVAESAIHVNPTKSASQIIFGIFFVDRSVSERPLPFNVPPGLKPVKPGVLAFSSRKKVNNPLR